MTISSSHASFRAPNPQDEAAIQVLLAALTLDEKIGLLSGQSHPGNTLPIERLQIPFLRCSDGPHGVHWNTPASTCYPVAIALAATFDAALVERVGQSLGRDCRARGVHILLAPGVNLYRAAVCSRNFEYLGEDPELSGLLAAAYIRGLQSQGVGGTVKHFALNFQEYDRHHVSSDADERTLREVYFRPFERAVQEGGVACVMMGYNLVNGEHASQSTFLIRDVLKGEWGFDGLVMSDWVSTYDGIGACIAGLDLEMPFAERLVPAVLKPALQRGIITPAMIDDKVRRLLRLMFAFGWLRREQVDATIPQDDPTSRATALEAARRAPVLLKNEGNLLPLAPEKLRRVLVVGRQAHPAVWSGGGSARARPFSAVSLLDGLRARLPQAEIVHHAGVVIDLPSQAFDTPAFTTADGQEGLAITYFGAGSNTGVGIDGGISPTIRLSWNHDLEVRPGIGARDFGLCLEGTFTVQNDGDHTFYLSSNFEAEVCVGGRVLFRKPIGDVGAPRNILTQTLELRAGEVLEIRIECRHRGLWPNIRFGVLPPGKTDPALAELEHLAPQFDAVVLCAGFDHEQEAEGTDRFHDLPGPQAEQIRRVCAANPRTVVVAFAGAAFGPVGWSDPARAALMAWYPGQEGGTALAELLCGDCNPSGCLPFTWEARREDRSSWDSYDADPVERRVRLSDGIFGGYRHHDLPEVPRPRFPFGHGLSYTQFAFRRIEAPTATIDPAAGLRVRFEVANTGARAGHATALVFVTDCDCALPRPVKELKDVAKVSLEAGESRWLEVTLPPRAFQYWRPDTRSWQADAGDFEILVGPTAADTPLRLRVRLA